MLFSICVNGLRKGRLESGIFHTCRRHCKRMRLETDLDSLRSWFNKHYTNLNTDKSGCKHFNLTKEPRFKVSVLYKCTSWNWSPPPPAPKSYMSYFTDVWLFEYKSRMTFWSKSIDILVLIISTTATHFKCWNRVYEIMYAGNFTINMSRFVE